VTDAKRAVCATAASPKAANSRRLDRLFGGLLLLKMGRFQGLVQGRPSGFDLVAKSSGAGV
jgi:hypothetical protein